MIEATGPVRICYVTTQALNSDGWGRHSVEVIRGVREFGVDPIMITANPDIESTFVDVPHHHILPDLFKGQATTARTLLRAPQLQRIIRTCDAVHVLAEPYAPLGALAHGHRPLFITAHGTWAIRPLQQSPSKFVFARAFNAAELVLCVSSYTCQRLKAILPDVKSRVLAGGVHPEEYQQPADRALLPDWVDLGPVIFSIGALKARKGYHIALEAVAEAQKVIPELTYVIAGSLTDAPDYVAQLKARADELGLGRSVRFLGKISQKELRGWYQYSDLFLLTPVNQGNSFEGLGLVYLEAGASGTPAIGTKDCGAQEAITDGKTGLLVPQSDVMATTDAIVGLLSRPDVLALMGEAARQRAQQLSWESYTRQLVTIYQQAIDQ